MGKKGKENKPAQPKAMMQLIDAFADAFRPSVMEEEAEEVFTVGRIREYFQAWPIPAMPDPLPPYLDELEARGFLMRTGFDGQPAIFCTRRDGGAGYLNAMKITEKMRAGIQTAEEVTTEDEEEDEAF